MPRIAFWTAAGPRLAVVVREGDVFEVGGGEMRTISSFLVAGPGHGMPSCYNAARQLTFLLQFTDTIKWVHVIFSHANIHSLFPTASQLPKKNFLVKMLTEFRLPTRS